MTQVTVRKLKFDGSVKSEWEGELTTHSADPNWLVVIHDPEHHKKFEDGGQVRADQLFVHCLNCSEPLTVLIAFDIAGQFEEAKCDAAFPAEWNGGVISFVDLDLDVIVAADYSYYVRDHETFEENRVVMGYSAEAIAQAQRGIELAMKLIADREFPFNEDF